MDEVKISVPAFEKLLDYTASGVGAVAGPMLANWRAEREGKAKLTAAQYDAEVRRIEAQSHAESLAIIAEAQAEARKSIAKSAEFSHGTIEFSRGNITQSLEFQSRKRLANVKSVVEDAAEQLADEKVSDHEPDHDWTARFFNCVQDVSSENMRKIWARLLTGEVKNPGQYSMRTMDSLRNMTKGDAIVFRNFCQFVLNREIVFKDTVLPEYDALSFSRLLHLQECGLIKVEHELIRKMNWDEFGRVLLGYQDGLLVIRRTREHDKELSLRCIGLTNVGGQLSTLVESTVRMDYLQVFAKYLQNMGRELDYLEGVSQLPNGQVSYTKQTRIQPFVGK